MNSIDLLSTTSTIQNREIEEYLGVVSHQIVIGANIFRDVFSSFRDLVGGSARGYQKDLEKWKEIGLNDLKAKAVELGANGILGLHIDFEDVSGGGKSMFMVSLSGTAVKIQNLENEKKDHGKFKVSFEELDYDVKRKNIYATLENEELDYLNNEDIQKFITYDIEVGDKVLEFFLETRPNDSLALAVEYFSNQSHVAINEFLKSDDFKKLSDTKLKRIATTETEKERLDFYTLLKEIDWFEPEILVELIESGDPLIMRKALVLSTLNKPFYTKDDIEPLRKLGQAFTKFEEVFPITKTTSSTFGKDKKAWICPACHIKNSFDRNSCVKCNMNRYGVNEKYFNPEKISKNYLVMADTLEERLKGR
jgi:uncharacterized protein YbjQ (UPF0145 family)